MTFDAWATGLDVAGDMVYLAGRFTTVNGLSRPSFAAVHRVTGTVQPWRPAPDVGGGLVRASGGLAQLYKTHPPLDERMDRIDRRASGPLQAYTQRD